MKKTTIILLSVLFFAINSCNKDEIVQVVIPDAPEGTAIVPSSINESEIGGSNLTVFSVYYPDAPIVDNSFETIVSEKATQVVMVRDDSNALKGLSYTQKNGSSSKVVPVDATSTLLSLLLLTPGMTVTEFGETTTQINVFKALPSYQKTLDAFKTNLSDNTLEQLLAIDKINALYSDLVHEFVEYRDNSQTKSAAIDLYGEKLSVKKNAQGIPEISNQAFRKIMVHRTYFDDNQAIDPQLLFEMGGGVATSWGSLFTFRAFEPTIKSDDTYNPPTQSTITDYWIIGLGTAESPEIPPSYVLDIDIVDAASNTCVKYALFPLIDIFSGVSNLVDKPGAVTEFINIAKDVKTEVKPFIYIADMWWAKDDRALVSGFINFIVSIGKAGLAVPGGAAAVGLSATAATAVVTALATGTALMSVTNITAFTVDLAKQPKYRRFCITTQLDAPVLLMPEDNSQESSNTVTLSWEENPLAYEYLVEVSKNSNFGEKTIESLNVPTKSFTLESSTTYYWRVYCIKGDDSVSEVSEVWTFTTGEEVEPETGTFTDERDGHVYKTVKIGDQVWMAENLAYLPKVYPTSTGSNDSPCYYVYGYDGTNVSDAKNTSNYKTYGVLYNWEAANNSAPEGWHLPTVAEWDKMAEYIANQHDYQKEVATNPNGPIEGYYIFHNVGNHLKSESGWKENGNGINDYGFSGKPGGWRFFYGAYDYIQVKGSWWTSTLESDNLCHFKTLLHNSSTLYPNGTSKVHGFSVRCIKD